MCMLNVLSRVLCPPYLSHLMGNLLSDGSEIEEREWASSGHLRLAERCSLTLHSAEELISERRKCCQQGGDPRATAVVCIQMETISLARPGIFRPLMSPICINGSYEIQMRGPSWSAGSVMRWIKERNS